MNTYYMTPDIIRESFVSLWASVWSVGLRIVLAIVVFLLGWLVAILVAKAAWHIVKVIQLDRGLESIGFKQAWEKSGHNLNAPLFFYELVKWFVIIGALMASARIVNLTEISDFLGAVVSYLPNVMIAVVVLVVGVLVARFLGHAVRGSAKAANISSAEYLATITRWAVIIFSVLIALERLQVGGNIINIAETGIIVAAALAFGLAFGLGGKSHAEEIIDKLRKRHQE